MCYSCTKDPVQKPIRARLQIKSFVGTLPTTVKVVDSSFITMSFCYLTAVDGAVNLKKFPIHVDVSGALNPSDILYGIIVREGVTDISIQSVVNSVVTFDNLDIPIDSGATKRLTIGVFVKSKGHYPEGSTFKTILDTTAIRATDKDGSLLPPGNIEGSAESVTYSLFFN